MKIRQTSIERKIDELTPDFVWSVSNGIEKYNCKFFNLTINLYNAPILKGVDKNGNIIEHNCCVPDFILLNSEDANFIGELCQSFEKGELLDYTLSNYFANRKGLYFIEAFGDYWHSEQLTGLSKEQHERQVVECYEKNGHHVLILWEDDILNFWDEKCAPKVNKFLAQFISDGNKVADNFNCKNICGLSDNCIRLMYDVEFRSNCNESEISNCADEISNFYCGARNVQISKYDAELDFARLKKWAKGETQKITRYGNLFLWQYFSGIERFVCNNDGLSLQGAMQNVGTIRECVADLLKNNNVVNFPNVLKQVAIKCNMQEALPFDVAEVLFRVKKSYLLNKRDVFFDPCCNYGETLVAAFLLGFKKYVGFVDNAQKLKRLKEIADRIGYANAEIVLSEKISDANIANYGVENAFALSCSDNCNEFYDYSCVAFKIKRLVLCSRQKSVFGMRNDIMACKQSYWKREEPSEYCFYNLISKDEYNYVKCEKCGLYYNGLRGHLLKAHGITTEQYKQLYPNCRVVSLSESEKIAEANKKKFNGVRKTYVKRFVYLLPDGNYTPKSDVYKRAWGVNNVDKKHIVDATTIDYCPSYAKSMHNGVEGEDYVVCAICGAKKGTLTQHLKKEHSISVEEYVRIYNGKVHCNKNKQAYHNASLQKWRTQFESGVSVRKASKANKEGKTRKRDDLTREVIVGMMKDGLTQAEMCKALNCTDTTLRKWMNQQGIKMPSKTIVAIRKAVKNGARLNLETESLSSISNLLAQCTMQEVLDMFGVKQTVFNSFLKMKKNELPNEIPESLSREDIVKYLFAYGFPYPKTENYNGTKIVQAIRNCKQLIDANRNISIGATFGNDLLLSFFPNFFVLNRNGGKSAMWHFKNNLEHILNDIKLHGKKYPTLSIVRNYLMEHERVTAFRPVVAKQIYDKYCPSNAIVLDPCGGWGGRMLGAYCCDKVVEYNCLDASKETCNGLNAVKNYFSQIVPNKIVTVAHNAFEDVVVNNGKYDLVFTSPPYFSKELYSGDKEQSCNRYPNYQDWLNGFLLPFVQKCFNCLKLGGFFIVNIDNVKIGNNEYLLQNDLLKLSKEQGFVLKETLFLKSRNRYTGKDGGEPIFVFVKQ